MKEKKSKKNTSLGKKFVYALTALSIVTIISLLVFFLRNKEVSKNFDYTGEKIHLVELYSPSCGIFCYNYTIHEIIFKNLNIDYSYERISIDSEKGKFLIKKYNVSKVPTAIIYNANKNSNLTFLYSPFSKNFNGTLVLENIDGFFAYIFGISQFIPYEKISLEEGNKECKIKSFNDLPSLVVGAFIKRNIANVNISEDSSISSNLSCNFEIDNKTLTAANNYIETQFSSGRVGCEKISLSIKVSKSNNLSQIYFKEISIPLFSKNEKSEDPLLKVFVMSYCPFGLQMLRAVNAMVKEIPELKENVIVFYIVSRGSSSNCYNGICSMHGEIEAREDLRQVCIREKFPEKFWNYIDCYINASINSYEEGEAHAIDCLNKIFTSDEVETINECMQNESLTLIEKDFNETSKYGVTGSPTLVLNDSSINEFNFGGRSSEAIKSIICCNFLNPPSYCNKTLDSRQAATWFSTVYSSSQTSSGVC